MGEFIAEIKVENFLWHNIKDALAYEYLPAVKHGFSARLGRLKVMGLSFGLFE